MSERDLGVAFKTLGCKVNQVESEDIAADLLGRGVRIVDEDHAAVVVVNTCAVTGEADAKARKAVRHALGAPASPIVVVTGCMAAMSPRDLEVLGKRVVVEADKALIPGRVADALGLGPEADHSRTKSGDRIRSGGSFRTRAMLKVEDGCDAFCSYCIVPFARGGPVPVAISDIQAAAASLVAHGAREIVLTGVNIGRYRDQGRDLADVVSAVANSGVERVRLSSIEPLDLTDRLLGVLGSLSAVCPHLHVPLQSGSDDVLARMARAYATEDYARLIGLAREVLPGLAVTTDVIAGFPGETDAEADETLEFCRQTGFSKLHVFRYSERNGTPAASMPDQVAPEQRARRAAALRDLDGELQRQSAQRHLGETVEVLVERVGGVEGNLVATGTTRDYLKVRVMTSAATEVGDLLMARVVDATSAPVAAVPAGFGDDGGTDGVRA